MNHDWNQLASNHLKSIRGDMSRVKFAECTDFSRSTYQRSENRGHVFKLGKYLDTLLFFRSSIFHAMPQACQYCPLRTQHHP
jgi:hypothetical protein